MKATQQLHELGQSLWLDKITRGLLTSGTLALHNGPDLQSHDFRSGAGRYGARGNASARGCAILCKILEQPDGLHCVQSAALKQG